MHTWAIFLWLPVSMGLMAHGGTVEGTVRLPPATPPKSIAVEKYVGKISGQVKPPPPPVAAVWLTAPGLTAPASPPDQVFDQSGYQFSSSLFAFSKNTRVFFPNRDPDFHNVFSLSRGNRFDLGRYKAGGKKPSRIFKRTGVVRLRCEIHPHMRANLLIVDTPYVVNTDDRGRFSIKNIPLGSYTIHAMITPKVQWQQPISVPKKGTVKVSFSNS